MLCGTFYSKIFFLCFHGSNIVSGVYGKKIWKFDEKSMVGLPKLHFTCPEQRFLENSFVASSFLFIQFLIFRKKTLTSGKDFCQGSWKSTLWVQMVNVWRKSFIWNNFIILLLHRFGNLSVKEKSFLGERSSAKFLKMQPSCSEKQFQENKCFLLKLTFRHLTLDRTKFGNS